MKFKCDTCGAVYEDYYPPDDTCLVCKKGLIRWTDEEVTHNPFKLTNNEEEEQ